MQFKSVHAIRIYELLKQYQDIGERALGIDEIKIAKFQKNPNGSKFMICNECEVPLKEYWRMSSEEKDAADRKTTIPAQYCENCKTKI